MNLWWPCYISVQSFVRILLILHQQVLQIHTIFSLGCRRQMASSMLPAKELYENVWVWINCVKINRRMLIHTKPTCKHNMFTPEEPAASIIGFSFSKIAFFWSAKWAVVGRAMEFWIKPTLTTRGSLNSSLSAEKEKAWNKPD